MEMEIDIGLSKNNILEVMKYIEEKRELHTEEEQEFFDFYFNLKVGQLYGDNDN